VLINCVSYYTTFDDCVIIHRYFNIPNLKETVYSILKPEGERYSNGRAKMIDR